jgi:hypothetical protein
VYIAIVYAFLGSVRRVFFRVAGAALPRESIEIRAGAACKTVAFLL